MYSGSVDCFRSAFYRRPTSQACRRAYRAQKRRRGSPPQSLSRGEAGPEGTKQFQGACCACLVREGALHAKVAARSRVFLYAALRTYWFGVYFFEEVFLGMFELTFFGVSCAGYEEYVSFRLAVGDFCILRVLFCLSSASSWPSVSPAGFLVRVVCPLGGSRCGTVWTSVPLLGFSLFSRSRFALRVFLRVLAVLRHFPSCGVPARWRDLRHVVLDIRRM